jgi:hypothetical protein
MPITKALKRDAPIYAPDYILDFRKKEVKQYLQANNLTKEQYIAEVRDEIKNNKKLITEVVRKDQNREAQRRFREKKKQAKIMDMQAKNKAASKIQLKFLRNKLFRMKPSDSAWNSYKKYTIANDRSNLYFDENPVQVLKNMIAFYKVEVFLRQFKGHKVWLGLTCYITNPEDHGLDEDANMQYEVKKFSSKSKLILSYNNSEISFILNNLYDQVNKCLEGYQVFLTIGDLDIHVAKVNALTGSSYTPLPKFIADKKAIINIKNKDNKCFLYSVLCGLECPERDAERVSKYTDRVKELKYKEEDMPMEMNKIIFFEKRNNIRINVYGLDRNDVVPLYVSSIKEMEGVPFIHLFYHDKHYSYIKNFNRLFGQEGKRHLVCPYCCQFTTNQSCRANGEEAMKKHMQYCISGQKVEMPEDGKDELSFTHYSNINKCPIRIYADFETYNDLTAKHNSKNGKTTFSTQHKPASYKMLIVSDFHIEDFQQVDKYYTQDHMYKGADADVHFINKISELEEFLNNAMAEQRAKYHNHIIMSEADKCEYRKSTQCWICKCQYSHENRKVRHHNHDTGLYHSTICTNCNIQIKDKWDIPVMFHNLNYDKNVFFKSLVHMKDKIKDVSILADNTQSYKAFSINKFKFIDTFRFMNSSLAKLIENLPESSMNFLKSLTKGDDEKFKYIKQKGYFPYEWFDSIDKLHLPITELKKEHFDNQLTLSKLEDAEWDYIQEFIEKNNIKTFEDFHDFYLHIDVNGLADVFESFRNTSLEYYKLDPCNYVGTPSFAWDAMLLMTTIEKQMLKLELITDIDMYLMLEKGIRGGQSVVFKKYAKANNKYIHSFDKTKPSNYIMYLDANNLYGEAMSHKLPMNGFKWLNNVDLATVLNYDENSDIGYILEVDLEYPDHLHNYHNDYPLAPEKIKPEGSTSEKLCGTFNDKNNYVVHISNLKYYLEQGMVLKNINRCIQFHQSAWLKDWIDKNTAYRQASKNEFEKDYFKLMNNAVFGKTMENVRGRFDVKCAFDEKYFTKYTSKPNFNTADKISNNDDFFMLMKLDKKTVKLDKPIYAGFSILDLSKLHMYKFHYGIMKPKYGDNLQLLMTDTDSLVYEVQTDDLYQQMYDMKEHFDMSEYSKENPIYDVTNKKVIGKFKDETKDKVITEFVGVRPKCYSFLTNDNKESKKLKGITKCVVKKNIKFDHYKKCVFNDLNDADKYVHVNSIRTKDMSNYSLVQKKKALDNNDDKRVWFGETSLAYGHYKLTE